MMTPRVGHSVSAFDKEMFIWEVANPCLSPNKMHKFAAESLSGMCKSIRCGATYEIQSRPTKVESSQRLIVISGGLEKMLREYLLGDT